MRRRHSPGIALPGRDPVIDSTQTRMMTAGLISFAIVIYATALFGAQFMPAAVPSPNLNLTFNSMAAHLLAGRYDVDPAIVGYEGFAVNGTVVAYWGVLPAVLRLPLMLFSGGHSWDFTALSCLAAVCCAAVAKIKTIRLIFRRFDSHAVIGNGMFLLLYWSVVVTILFSGPQIEFLKPSIYQEVCFWSGALAAIFAYWGVGGLVHGRFVMSTLCALAITAGLALLTRVSTGVGLYAACGLLFAVLAVTRQPHALRARLVLPLSLLALFLGIAAWINYRRWGNPLIFADYHRYIMNVEHPEWLTTLATYGLFNLARIPLGFCFYFVPMVFPPASGGWFLQSGQAPLLDFAELPPSSFFLTDPLLIGLTLYGCRAIFGRTDRSVVDRTQSLSIALGLCTSGLLMLCAISMSHRYRIDFYPFIEFGAFIGLIHLLNRKVPLHRATGNFIIGAAATSIGASFLVLALYRLSHWMPTVSLLRADTVEYYEHQFAGVLLRLAH